MIKPVSCLTGPGGTIEAKGHSWDTEGTSEGTADRIFVSASYTLGAAVYVETLSTSDNAGTGAPGAFSAAAFVTGGAAADGNDRIVYNAATGQLFNDADGSGGIVAVLFATFDGKLALSPQDFMVI